MDKLLCGPQGGVIVYKDKYDLQINTSIFPKTQGGPIQTSLFAKAMCFLKLSSMNVNEYAKNVIHNTNLVINELKSNDISTINNIAYNHIILVDTMHSGFSGKFVEETLLNMVYWLIEIKYLMIKNALITSGIELGRFQLPTLITQKLI